MTVREIARLAGVSASTVSNVINDRSNVSAETKKNVRQLLQKYNYTAKKRSRANKMNIIFLKYRIHGKAVDENQGFISSIVDNIERLCRKNGYDLSIVNANPDNIEDEIKIINEAKPAGVIFLGTEYISGSSKFLNEIKPPLISMDNSMRTEDIDAILMDNRKISYMIISYLHSMGHKKIGYIKSNLEISNLSERYLGYLENMPAFKMQPMEPIEVSPTMIEAYKELSAMAKDIDFKKYDALICDFDSIAIAAIRVLNETGIKIPEQISVIGVDNIPYSSMVVPSLTTISISRYAMAYFVVDRMMKRIAGIDTPSITVKIDGELVVRESTARRSK